MIKKNQKLLNGLLIIIDGLVILASLILSWGIRFKTGIISIDPQIGYLGLVDYIKPVIYIVPIYLVIFNIFRLYEPFRLKNIYEEFINLIKANFYGLLMLVLYLYVFKIVHFSRYLLIIFATISIALTTIERAGLRYVLRFYRKKGYNLKHIIIVGYSELSVEFMSRLEKNRHWGYNVVGILDDLEKIGHRLKDAEIIGRTDELESYIEGSDIDEVIITLPIDAYNKLKRMINVCEKNGVRTRIIPDYYRYIPATPYVEDIDGLPIINVRRVPLDSPVNKTFKRILDIAGSLAAIIIFSPVLIVTAICVKTSSPGPIIYRQERVGLNKKNFMMYKFRSMAMAENGEDKNTWSSKEEARKTKFGSLIRKTSIDELPQLFNVLFGDMSLVGPRPERPYFVEKFKEEIPKYMIKHQVRPGITGWAQVNGWRGDTSIKKRIEFDIYYIENWRLSLDMKILWLTVFKGFVNKNAY